MLDAPTGAMGLVLFGLSTGSVAGALPGMGPTAVRFPVGRHPSAGGVLIAAAGVRAALPVPHGTGREAADVPELRPGTVVGASGYGCRYGCGGTGGRRSSESSS